jgi:hypothetical protein
LTQRELFQRIHDALRNDAARYGVQDGLTRPREYRLTLVDEQGRTVEIMTFDYDAGLDAFLESR